MPLTRVHFMCKGKSFWADKLSSAYILYRLSWLVNMILPLMIVFRSDGLWIKSSSFEEQPDVNFKHQYLVILEVVRPHPGQMIYSTFPRFNSLFERRFIRSPQVSNFESDHNHDGKYDELSFDLKMPLKTNEEVSGVDVFLLFDYKLRSKVPFNMEAMVRIDYRSMTSGSSLQVVGDLTLHQKELIHSIQQPDNFSNVLENMFRQPPSQRIFSLDDVMQEYQGKNFTTILSANAYKRWSTGRDVSTDSFQVHVSLNYAPQEIRYRFGFWAVMKWASIQYLAVFFAFYLVIQKIRNVLFEQNLIHTIHCSE